MGAGKARVMIPPACQLALMSHDSELEVHAFLIELL
jgi:hypothetical protein